MSKMQCKAQEINRQIAESHIREAVCIWMESRRSIQLNNLAMIAYENYLKQESKDNPEAKTHYINMMALIEAVAQINEEEEEKKEEKKGISAGNYLKHKIKLAKLAVLTYFNKINREDIDRETQDLLMEKIYEYIKYKAETQDSYIDINHLEQDFITYGKPIRKDWNKPAIMEQIRAGRSKVEIDRDIFIDYGKNNVIILNGGGFIKMQLLDRLGLGMSDLETIKQNEGLGMAFTVEGICPDMRYFYCGFKPADWDPQAPITREEEQPCQTQSKLTRNSEGSSSK